MIADLHCHFPMHLVHNEVEHPHGRVNDWWQQVLNRVRGEGLEIVAELSNDEYFGRGWRVGLPGLQQGGASLVCSVLYWPFSEFELASLEGKPPDPGAFVLLMTHLQRVEESLASFDPDGPVIVRSESDLNTSRMRFVHCVEGGFQLGPQSGDVVDQIRWLAEHGVLYITLAHLFFRGVAADAPAIPILSDEQYDRIFHQPTDGLTDLGRCAITAMWEQRVAVDVSHMRRDAVKETLELLDRLDPGRTLPVFASHVGAASAGPPDHAYNLTPETMRAIAARQGVIGVITANHLLALNDEDTDSRAILQRHIGAIAEAVGGHGFTAFGTDLDGFIRPTLPGIETASDLSTLEGWVAEDYPADAEAILHGNAERVIRAVFALRDAGPAVPTPPSGSLQPGSD